MIPRSTTREKKYMVVSLSSESRPRTDGRSMRFSMNQCMYRSWRKYVADVTAKASVVTARNRPRMRSAGRPRTSATRAATTIPPTMARTISTSYRPKRSVVVAPPNPASAHCPREMWPARPVSTYSEMATMA
jgi:hypothetical protein